MRKYSNELEILQTPFQRKSKKVGDSVEISQGGQQEELGDKEVLSYQSKTIYPRPPPVLTDLEDLKLSMDPKMEIKEIEQLLSKLEVFPNIAEFVKEKKKQILEIKEVGSKETKLEEAIRIRKDIESRVNLIDMGKVLNETVRNFSNERYEDLLNLIPSNEITWKKVSGEWKKEHQKEEEQYNVDVLTSKLDYEPSKERYIFPFNEEDKERNKVCK